MIIDTHVHLDDEKYQEDLDLVIERANRVGVKGFIDPGIDLRTSKNAVANAKRYPGVYAAVGIHPHEAGKVTEEEFLEIQTLTTHKKVVAIGEIGLDYYYDFCPKEIQIQWFQRQLNLSLERGLPVIVHDREAHQDTFDLLSAFSQKGGTGVIHCYSGSVELMREYVKKGFFIGLDGPVTFKNAVTPKQVAKEIPLEFLLVETDGPYLAPVPFRGKRNEPSYLLEIIKWIALWREIEEKKLVEILEKNTKRCFPKMRIVDED